MELFQAITNMTAVSFAQHMVNGISLGSLYALIAIGYTMVYGILLMINFAHADIVMMACYFALFGITTFHIPWYLTFILTIAATALLGVIIERSAYRPLRDAPKNSVLISAIGASFLLENLANYLFSGRFCCTSSTIPRPVWPCGPCPRTMKLPGSWVSTSTTSSPSPLP